MKPMSRGSTFMIRRASLAIHISLRMIAVALEQTFYTQAQKATQAELWKHGARPLSAWLACIKPGN